MCSYNSSQEVPAGKQGDRKTYTRCKCTLKRTLEAHKRWSQSDNKGEKGNTQHPRQKPEHRQNLK